MSHTNDAGFPVHQRCRTCRWWQETRNNLGECGQPRDDCGAHWSQLTQGFLIGIDGHQWEDSPAELITHGDFGCVQWEAKEEAGDGT